MRADCIDHVETLVYVGSRESAADPADSIAVAGFFVGVGGHWVMAKKVKKEKPKKGFNIFDEDESAVASSEEELPKDEAGRRKIKRQYEDLLGIRIQKLRGRILNRERINKTIEGIYFICAECAKVCHNVDDGLMEDPDNVRNLCGPCSTKPPTNKDGGKDKTAKGRQAAA
jgi:hypothetical protein